MTGVGVGVCAAAEAANINAAAQPMRNVLDFLKSIIVNYIGDLGGLMLNQAQNMLRRSGDLKFRVFAHKSHEIPDVI